MPTKSKPPCDDQTRAAWERDNYAIPKYVYLGWKAHYDNSRARGISFRFTLIRWHLWWKAELHRLGADKRRGNRKGHYMMCRFGDRGDYAEGNVYAGTHADNAADVDRRSRADTMRAWHSTHDCHLKGKRGDDHPKSRAVLTPQGRYGSIALAAEAHGITRAGAFYRAHKGTHGWAFA